VEGQVSILRPHVAQQEDGALDAVEDGALDDPARAAWVPPPALVLQTGNGTPLAVGAAPRSITAVSLQQAFPPGVVGDGTVEDGVGDGAAVSVGAVAGAGARDGDVGAAAGAGVLGGGRLGVPSGPGLRTITARGWPTTMRRLTT